jgi:hypothetical protein
VWNADHIELSALVMKDGASLENLELSHLEGSRYRVEVPTPENGIYEVIVFAFQSSNGNTGLDRTSFSVG